MLSFSDKEHLKTIAKMLLVLFILALIVWFFYFNSKSSFSSSSQVDNNTLTYIGYLNKFNQLVKHNQKSKHRDERKFTAKQAKDIHTLRSARLDYLKKLVYTEEAINKMVLI
jgi:predicted PurR-regulated permease PerM